MVTSRDVARHAGVSQATVSRAMSPSGLISAKSREKVLASMVQLGYVPNAAARTMRTGLTNTIGVVVADLTNPFYPEILDALTAAFDEAGRRVIVWNSDGEHNKAAIEAINEGSIDGLVFTTAVGNSASLNAALDKRYPIVLINRTVEGLECDQVTSENIQGGASVADYFLRHERRRIAYIGGPEKVSTSRERERGFRERLEAEDGIADSAYIRRGEFTHQSGFELMRELLMLEDPPDAAFCSNDLIAFGALDCARRLKIRVPEELWIVGYDDIEMSSWDAFALSTVRQGSREMAREGARLLLERIEDPWRETRSVYFPGSLIIRETSGQEQQLLS